MKHTASKLHAITMPGAGGRQARAQIVLLVLAAVVVGFGGGAVWFCRKPAPGSPARTGHTTVATLSDGTKTVLRDLSLPVEIRFYSLLDPTSGTTALGEFAERVDQVLSLYEREGAGKIKVTRFKSRSDSATDAAFADGIKPFNLDKGEGCCLGLALVCKDQKESLPYLAPEWEQALEPDLTRAMVRVVAASAPKARSVAAASPDTAAVEEIRRLFPDLNSISVDEGIRALRQKALTAFAAAAQETETRVKDAQERLQQAQSNNSEGAQEVAKKELQQIHSEQTDKLKQIAARLQAQIAALEQLKKK
ncbi:MAG: Gldg family protein [Verrucomicrobia bacterium]|nr:Gldg family protein [Verrucomicrobiota bacterium]